MTDIQLIKKRDYSGDKNNFFGKHHTEEAKNLMRLARLGKKQPPHIAELTRKFHTGRKRPVSTGLKISAAKKGKKRKPFTDETRKNMRLAHVGKPSGMKDKHHKPETIEKLRQAVMGVNNPNFHKHLSEKHRKNISLSKKGIPNEKLKGTKRTPEQIIKIKKARALQIFKRGDTKPERMMQLALTLHGIKFEKQKLFENDQFYHRVDIFIEPNICVEVDGDYWHTRPNMVTRDRIIDHELPKMGCVLIRIWEKDIKKDANNCAETVIRLINQLRIQVKI